MSQRGFPADIEIRSQRLLLRRVRREDLDLEERWPDFEEPIYHHYNPPRDDPNSKDHRYIQALRIFDIKLSILDGNILVGYVGLYDTNFERGESWMGIQFAANQRGRGYCKESLHLLTHEFFGSWGMSSMKLEVAAFNLPGIRCYESIGWLASRQFWHTHAYQRKLDFENDPRIAPINHHFRRTAAGVEVDYLEMELTSRRFLEIHSDA